MNSLSDGNQSDLQSQIDADGDIHGGGIGTISFVSCGNKEAKEAADATLADSAKEEESRPRLTKETAVDLGAHKTSLNRTLDVYDIQELCDDPDPHATLPFISHHTLNISRDLDDKTAPIKDDVKQSDSTED